MGWLDIGMQWLHLAAAATGIGGLIYARWVLFPALGALPSDSKTKLAAQIGGRVRPIAFTVIGALLVSGLYNLFPSIQGRSSTYHMVLGIKLLLALHFFTVLFLLAVPPGANPARDARRPRLMAGAAISGIAILFLSAWLRRGF